MDISYIIALLALAISLFSLFVAFFLNREQQSTQAFIAYTEKYDDLTSDMPPIWHDRHNKDSKILDVDDELGKKIRPYFHLCSQQFHLYTHGLIKCSVWKIWEPEIEHNLCTELLRKTWGKDTLVKEFRFYPDFSNFVNDVLDKGPGKKVADSYFHITRPFSRRKKLRG